MRTLRWFMAAVVLLATQALLVSPASACIIDSFGVNPVSVSSDGTVPPGGTVSYGLRIVRTDDSPGDSRFQVVVAGQVVASGMATPSTSGGEWSTAGTFQMPPLGPGEMQINAELQLLDTAGYMTASTPLSYNGTPPAAAPPAAQAPVTPASGSPTPPDRQRSPRPTHKPKPKPQPAPVRHVERPATHQPTTIPVHQTVPQAAPVATPRRQAVAAPVRSRPAARTVVHKRVNRAVPHHAMQMLPDRVAVTRALAAPVPAAERHGPSGSALLLLLALFGGAGGVVVVLRRRRAPDAPATVVVDLRAAEIEAELQEIVAEGRLDSQRRERAPLS